MRVLAIGAHPDDIELGCGGTIAKHIKKGDEVYAIVLSKGEAHNSNLNRIEESKKALNILGVNKIKFFDLRDTRIFEQIREAIIIIEQAIAEFNPERVYTMSKADHHQDHWAVYKASIAACRKIPQILGYETPSSLPIFTPAIFVDITPFLDLKIKALNYHISQSKKPYLRRDSIILRAKYRGLQIGVEAAEAFEVYKFLL